MSQTPRKPVLAVTLGDPAGVGPELCLRLLNRAIIGEIAFQPVVIGDASVLKRVSDITGLPFSGKVFGKDALLTKRECWIEQGPVVLDLEEVDGNAIEPGRVQSACGKAAGRYIREAVEGVQRGVFDAILTAPLNKESLHLGGYNFPGHTEMLADLTGCRGKEAMLLYSEEIAVTFATLHTSVARVPDALNGATIERVGRLSAEIVSRLRSRPARVGVLGFNPHSGEAGLFGDEEKQIILPSIQRLRAEGIDAHGPLVPDAAFVPRSRKHFDVFITMYHDQGSIPFKMLAFDEGVNLTMGLPVIRTSPDHGTAFDIAWKGTASASSFFAASDLAARLAIAARSGSRN